jgi:hypothetical protein
MRLPDIVISALIAGTTSLLISFITYRAAKRHMILEREKLERELERKLTERLYEVRLKHYPKAFEITDNLGKKTSTMDATVLSRNREVENQLREWKKGEVSFILSGRALRVFYKLVDVLSKNPERGTFYSEAQLANIWNARVKFRRELRRDIGLLFKEDVQIKP